MNSPDAFKAVLAHLARWRSTGDAAALRAAVDGYTAIGARFEEAVTRTLLPGADGETGREMLHALQCSLPVQI